MQYCHHHVKCTNPIKKAQTTVIRLLAHHKPLHTMRAVCAYIGTLPKCMQVFARSVRGGDSEAIEQTISNFCAQNIILCGFKIIRKVWNLQTNQKLIRNTTFAKSSCDESNRPEGRKE